MKALDFCLKHFFLEVNNLDVDNRNKLLLTEIIKHPDITSKELQEKYDLSRRQVGYSLKKINTWLEQHGKPKIIRSNGTINVDRSVLELFSGEYENDVQFYVPIQKERTNLLIIYILTSDEELSLNHFISKLMGSKNTILKDLNVVRTRLKKNSLSLDYTRQRGYEIIGNEWEKRSIMLDVLYQITNMYEWEQFLRLFMDVSESDIDNLRVKLSEIEEKLLHTFVDTEIASLPYAIEGVFKRINNGQLINENFFVEAKELSDTKEFESIQFLVNDKEDIPDEEYLYLTLQLLTSNTFKKRMYLDKTELPKLRNALRKMLDQFEQKAILPVAYKDELVNKLFLHFKPAYYRIKYHLTTDYRLLHKIDEEFEILHSFVKESVTPLIQYLEADIPEEEVTFITLFIAGHVIENNKQTSGEFKQQAVVVCPNGLSVSKLMERNLSELFPEIYFYPAMSIREFKESTVPYDVVFSSVPISVPIDKKVFIVNEVMDSTERSNLRRNVVNSIYLKNESGVGKNNIIEIIEKHTTINNLEGLKKDLETQLTLEPEKQNQEFKELNELPYLNELLTENNIQVIENVNDWHEAIEIASTPLLKHKNISNDYVESMKEEYPNVAENIVLQNHIAIPHSAVENGVNSLGMSLLYVKNGIPNYNSTTLHFVVVIAAIDKKTHFNALMELMELAGDKDELIEIRNCENSKEIEHVINDFSKKTKGI